MSTNNQFETAVVLGGTGHTGRLVVQQLLSRGYRVKVLTRRSSRPAFLDEAVELVKGDIREQVDVDRAVQGADAVVLTHGSDDGQGTAREIDFGGVERALKAAKGRKIRFVLMSAIYVTRPEHPRNAGQEVFAWKAQAEQLLRESGQPYTIVRASWLSPTQNSESAVRFEQGDTGDGSVEVSQVARVLVEALQDVDAIGKTLEVYSSTSEITDFHSAFHALKRD